MTDIERANNNESDDAFTILTSKYCYQNFEGYSESPATLTGLEMTLLRTILFGRFLLRLSRIKCPQVMSMLRFGQTAPSFGYEFVAQNSVSNSPCIQVIHFVSNVLGI